MFFKYVSFYIYVILKCCRFTVDILYAMVNQLVDKLVEDGINIDSHKFKHR